MKYLGALHGTGHKTKHVVRLITDDGDVLWLRFDRDGHVGFVRNPQKATEYLTLHTAHAAVDRLHHTEASRGVRFTSARVVGTWERPYRLAVSLCESPDGYDAALTVLDEKLRRNWLRPIYDNSNPTFYDEPLRQPPKPIPQG